MIQRPQSLLRKRIIIAAGTFLLIASLMEGFKIIGNERVEIGSELQIAAAILSAFAALLIFLAPRWGTYVALPVSLGILFWDIHNTNWVYVSWYEIVSGLLFLITALLCFMLIRAYKL